VRQRSFTVLGPLSLFGVEQTHNAWFGKTDYFVAIMNWRVASRGGIRLKLDSMLSDAVRSILVLSGLFAHSLCAQVIPGPPAKAAAPIRVEPGLEVAVKWKWRVAPSDEKDWGLEAPTPIPTPPPPVVAKPTPEIRPTLYEVKGGDALILIGKRFGLTVPQLKGSNGLKNDTIRVGQILKIPTLAELSAMAPPPKKVKRADSRESTVNSATGGELDPLRLQIFLDREQFSAGPITAEPGPGFARTVILYESTHADAKDDVSLGAKARVAVENVFTRYKLRAEDFRFIASSKVVTIETKQTPVPVRTRPKKTSFHAPVVAAPPPTYQELTTARMLAYRTPWEFVAERFHCQQTYLRTLNDKLPAIPGIGADFEVPNVIPFEIENAFVEPLQPQADPNNRVTATVVGLSQLNIYQSGTLIAVMPMFPARPGLHGRGSWTILDVIPRPRLATFQEERKQPTQKPGFGSANPEPSPSASKAILSSEEYLAAGPRNPVGIIWINLAKSNSIEPLPYGLHGTSIPDRMNMLESIGGFRLANWDIARAVRQLPFGTPIDWK
jgi:lipoprotein-anchoring transpeptidase ErfK/SrfK